MRVTLNHSNHVYKDGKGQTYKSVSSIITQYKHPFDACKKDKHGKTLIENYAAKHGQTEQYWLDKWEKHKDWACEKGSAFHDLKEMLVNGRGIHKTDKVELPVQNPNKQWQLPAHEGMFNLLWPGVYTELTIWNYQHRIAGTADLITIYPDRTFDIDDYKTNGKFETSSFMGRPMKYPCTNLPDCHLGHYTLQLSLYAWMLIQFGLKPGKLRLHHYDIPESEVESIVKHGILPEIQPTIYQVVYAADEVAAITKERLTELARSKRRVWEKY